MARASRPSRARILADLRMAARRGDRAALALAVDHMKTLALSPRYWEKYLELLRNPLARLIDLLVIKQGERIARQKGWKLPAPSPRGPRPPVKPRPEAGRRRRPRGAADGQPTLFDL
jgi:hypothetical protein